VKRTATVLAAVIFFAMAVHADEPPSWSDFDVVSGNGQYVAKVRAESGGGHKVSVYYKDRGVLYWSCDYVYEGYSAGALSNDGSTFAYVSQWYYADEPVVYMYRRCEATGSVTGEEFEIPRDRLKDTVSHRLWLCEDCKTPYIFRYPDGQFPVLEINAIDGSTYRLSLSDSGVISIGKKR